MTGMTCNREDCVNYDGGNCLNNFAEVDVVVDECGGSVECLDYEMEEE